MFSSETRKDFCHLVRKKIYSRDDLVFEATKKQYRNISDLWQGFLRIPKLVTERGYETSNGHDTDFISKNSCDVGPVLLT